MKSRASHSSSDDDDARARRSRVSQTDVPAYSLDQAIRIPQAIAENYALKPTAPLNVAAALSISPSSSLFRMLCGASIAYGLTEGGYNSSQIEVTPLGRRIVAPTVEGDDAIARREAALRPRVSREFLSHYDGNKFPREEIAVNVLASMGVPRDSAKRTLELIRETAKAVGFFRDIKGATYVSIEAGAGVPSSTSPPIDLSSNEADEADVADGAPPQADVVRTAAADNRKVFITHGKDRSFLESLKSLLVFGELEPVVSVERESVSQPVPDKVMGDMRQCSAAIIHVDAEQKLMSQDGAVQIMLNSNVLIEIGAAMALYGRRFILLVREGITLPSNLQGLYVVTYSGEKMDGDTTIRLLKAIQDIKNHPPPQRAQ